MGGAKLEIKINVEMNTALNIVIPPADCCTSKAFSSLVRWSRTTGALRRRVVNPQAPCQPKFVAGCAGEKTA
jgi:hypothetical protein